MPLSLPSHLVNHRIQSLQPRSNIFVKPKVAVRRSGEVK